MKRWLSLILLVALLSSHLTVALAAPRADTIYIVQRGDTLARIAARFGVSIAAIAQVNGIRDINRIYVGQRLTIPTGSGGAGSGGTSACPSPYTVQRGDTLTRIAARCGVSASAIITLNNIRDIHLIYVGQKLILPGGSSGPAPTPTPPPSGGGTTVIGSAAIANPSFEQGWSTDGATGNQTPNGWNTFSPPKNATLPFPTKNQEGSVVAAISSGPGEYVHKLSWQLPADEQAGLSRAILLEGGTVYKAFGLNGAHALQLSQTLFGTPGTSLRVYVYILGETHDAPTNAAGTLEDDHFVALVKLGGVEDRRTYAQMKTHFDVPGNQRPWNRFTVTAQVPASGQLPLEITLQQNWPGRTDFFIDNLSGEVLR
jgi:LysM repeat protein